MSNLICNPIYDSFPVCETSAESCTAAVPVVAPAEAVTTSSTFGHRHEQGVEVTDVKNHDSDRNQPRTPPHKPKRKNIGGGSDSRAGTTVVAAARSFPMPTPSPRSRQRNEREPLHTKPNMDADLGREESASATASVFPWPTSDKTEADKVVADKDSDKVSDKDQIQTPIPNLINTDNQYQQYRHHNTGVTVPASDAVDSRVGSKRDLSPPPPPPPRPPPRVRRSRTVVVPRRGRERQQSEKFGVSRTILGTTATMGNVNVSHGRGPVPFRHRSSSMDTDMMRTPPERKKADRATQDTLLVDPLVDLTLMSEEDRRQAAAIKASAVYFEWTREGFLYKTGPKGRRFLRRWVKLDGDRVTYSQLSFSSNPRGSIPVSEIYFVAPVDRPASQTSTSSDAVLNADERTMWEFQIGVRSPTTSSSLSSSSGGFHLSSTTTATTASGVSVPMRNYVFASSISERDRLEWIQHIGSACVRLTSSTAVRLMHSLKDCSIVGFLRVKYGVTGSWVSSWGILTGRTRTLYLVDLPLVPLTGHPHGFLTSRATYAQFGDSQRSMLDSALFALEGSLKERIVKFDLRKATAIECLPAATHLSNDLIHSQFTAAANIGHVTSSTPASDSGGRNSDDGTSTMMICLTIQDRHYRVVYLQAECREHSDLWRDKLNTAWTTPEDSTLAEQYLTIANIPVAVDNALKHISTHGVLLGDIYRRSGQQCKLHTLVHLLKTRPWTVSGAYHVPSTSPTSRCPPPPSYTQNTVGSNSKSANAIAAAAATANQNCIPSPADTEEFTYELAGALKLYFRSLSECILTERLYPEWIRVGSSLLSNVSVTGTGLPPPPPPPEKRLDAYKQLLGRLPKVNYLTLKKLVIHLVSISHHSDRNQMNAYNLSVVMGPSLLYTRRDTAAKTSEKAHWPEVTTATTTTTTATGGQVDQISFAKHSYPMEVLHTFLTHFRFLFDVSPEEEARERRLQTSLILFREAKLGGQSAAKPAGDFLQSVYLHNKASGRCLNVKISPTMTTRALIDQLLESGHLTEAQLVAAHHHRKRPPPEYALYEVLYDGSIERPLAAHERILDAILWRWQALLHSSCCPQVTESHLIVRECPLAAAHHGRSRGLNDHNNGLPLQIPSIGLSLTTPLPLVRHGTLVPPSSLDSPMTATGKCRHGSSSSLSSAVKTLKNLLLSVNSVDGVLTLTHDEHHHHHRRKSSRKKSSDLQPPKVLAQWLLSSPTVFWYIGALPPRLLYGRSKSREDPEEVKARARLSVTIFDLTEASDHLSPLAAVNDLIGTARSPSMSPTESGRSVPFWILTCAHERDLYGWMTALYSATHGSGGWRP